MAAVVIDSAQFAEQTTGKNASATLKFSIVGAADTAAALTALGASELCPATYEGLERKGRTARTVYIDPDNDDNCIFAGEASYAPAGQGSAEDYTPPETGDSEWNFDTGGGTQHITQSRTTKGYASGIDPATGEAYALIPGYRGAIGVTNSGVEGVDINVSIFNFSETHYIADAYITTNYKKLLFRLTNKVNNASFRGFAAGEVLFLGASGSKRVQGDWQITFRFAASPNKVITSSNLYGLAVGQSVRKDGWQYLWILYDDVVLTKDIAGEPYSYKAQRLHAVYVEEVYEPDSFSLLGIGSS